MGSLIMMYPSPDDCTCHSSCSPECSETSDIHVEATTWYVIYNEYDHTCMVTYIMYIYNLTYIYIFYACSCANQFIYQVCVQHWNRFAVNPDPIFRESHQLSFEDHHFPPCPSHQLSSLPCSNSSKAKDRKARKWPEWHLTSNQHPNVLVGF